MDKSFYKILDSLSQGVLFLDSDFRIVFANRFLCKALRRQNEHLFGLPLYEVFPKFGVPYLREVVSDALSNGCPFFFSAAMHRDLLPFREKMNVHINSLTHAGKKYLFLEFIDVTGQFERVRPLKENISRLCVMNQQLLEKEKEIQALAYYDTLTGVANRTLFYELAQKLIQTAARNREMLCLMFIDVDKFKCINDTYGHETGDRVLRQVAGILTGAVRQNDVVARYGGDEFLVLLPQIREEKNYETVASKIILAKNSAINSNGMQLKISFSIGISFYPQDGEHIDQLIAKADRAMYRAKKKEGSDTFIYR